MEEKVSKKLEFPTLTASEIEVRVDRVWKDGCSLLIHKNARIDMELLDTHVGPANWQRKQIPTATADGRIHMVCSVGIYDEQKSEWIWKSDVGSESSWAREKGQASDSFKRACTNWGIGRELYSAPDIVVSALREKEGNTETIVNIEEVTDQPGVYITRDQFEVTQLLYDEKKHICALAIKNVTTGKMAFVRDFRDDATKKKEREEKAAAKENVASPVLTPPATLPEITVESMKKMMKDMMQDMMQDMIKDIMQELVPAQTETKTTIRSKKASSATSKKTENDNNNINTAQKSINSFSSAPEVDNVGNSKDESFVEKVENTETPKDDVSTSATLTPQESSSTTGTSDIRSIKVDVGTKFVREERTLGDLKATELRWVYGQTKSPEVKKACLMIASSDDYIKNVFIEGGIPVK